MCAIEEITFTRGANGSISAGFPHSLSEQRSNSRCAAWHPERLQPRAEPIIPAIGSNSAQILCARGGAGRASRGLVGGRAFAGEQGRFLEHDKALLARACYELPIRQDMTALGLGQARHDVEERGLAATAWTEKTDKLAFQHPQLGGVIFPLAGSPRLQVSYQPTVPSGTCLSANVL